MPFCQFKWLISCLWSASRELWKEKKKVSLVPGSALKVLVVARDWTRHKSLIILELALFSSLGGKTKAHYLKAILPFQFTTELSMTGLQIELQAPLFKPWLSAARSLSRKPPSPWWILFGTWASRPSWTPRSSADGRFFQPRSLIPH